MKYMKRIIVILIVCLLLSSCELLDPITVTIINKTDQTIYVDVKEQFSTGDKINCNMSGIYTIEKNSTVTATGTKTAFSSSHLFTSDGEKWIVGMNI
jgi:hypothetical protein